MIIKSYLVEDDIKFFEKNKSILFYGENTGLKNHFRRFIISNFKVTIFKKTQDEILNNTEQFFQIKCISKIQAPIVILRLLQSIDLKDFARNFNNWFILLFCWGLLK